MRGKVDIYHKDQFLSSYPENGHNARVDHNQPLHGHKLPFVVQETP